MLENWLKSANVQRFEDLKSLMVKDRILAAILSRLSNFLIEQGVENEADLERKGTVFIDPISHYYWMYNS